MIKENFQGPNTELFLDFDGVICDSAFEAFRVLLCTRGLIEDPFSSNLDQHYVDFISLRARVGPAWNYFFVFEELFGQRSTVWNVSDKALEFQAMFFSTREKWMEKAPDQWLRLHQFYPLVVSALSKLPAKSFYILTNKGSAAVSSLMELNDLSPKQIFSLSELAEFNTKASFLKSRPGRVRFVDDHLETVLEARTQLSLKDDVRWASWGYGKPNDTPHAMKIENFEKWLTNES